MIFSGPQAEALYVVRLDTFETVNRGKLTYADTETGEVRYIDKTNNMVVVQCGTHNLRVLRKLWP